MNAENEKLNMNDICGQRGCFAYREGHCDCLSDTDFGGRGCPFFKSVKQYEEELVKYSRPDKSAAETDDFLAANADLIKELDAMEAEAERIESEGTEDDEPSDEDGWDDEGGDSDA